MRTLICALGNRKGEGYLGTVLLVLCLCLILSVVLVEILLAGTIRGARDRMRADADSYLQSHAIETFDALKRGVGYGNRLSEDDIREGVLSALGYGPDGSGSITYGEETGVRAVCSDPQVDVCLYPDAVAVTVTVRLRGYARLFGQVRILPDLPLRVRTTYALRQGGT